MNERFQREELPGRGLGALVAVLAVGCLVAVVPLSVAQAPKQPGAVAAAKRGLREKPLAAGRNKAALVAEEEAARAQAAAKPDVQISVMDCGACHTCDGPVKESPCLRMCPRSVAEAFTFPAAEILPGDLVLLDSFEWAERRFMPVPFNHKSHTHLAGTGSGCETCHHHFTEEQAHPPCALCHKLAFARTSLDELRMPSLKGAYHRQCMGCHRSWSHHTKCSVCHLIKGDQKKPTSVADVPFPGDAASRGPIKSPEHILHRTDCDRGAHVIFRHREHIDRYGYTCERCHLGQSCGRCHEQVGEPTPPPKGERHANCFPCHEDDACERCHSQQERAAPQRLDHAVTGFDLSKYHERLTCRACHKRLYFIRRLEPQCQSCHQAWDPDTFDHAVTGQVLDENHAEIDCGDCHTDRKFDQPPKCDECHDEDEGFVFPNKRPGPPAKTEPRAKG